MIKRKSKDHKKKRKLCFILMLLFTEASWDRIKTCFSSIPLSRGARWPLALQGAARWEPGWQGMAEMRQAVHTDGWSDDFLHKHRHERLLPPPRGPCPAGNTHSLYLTHTHIVVRPPIKSKVVCFYWSFALTSGLSFWRLYLSVSSWKSSVDNAQCFQLGENQTPGALAILPPSPLLQAHLPSLFSSALTSQSSTIPHSFPLTL